jgi:hypothetical protein
VQAWQVLHGSPFALKLASLARVPQQAILASRRAIEVLPVPRGP